MARDRSTEREPLLGHEAGPHDERPTNGGAATGADTDANSNAAAAAAAAATSTPLPSRPALPRAQFIQALIVGLLILVIADIAVATGDLALNAFYESSLCHRRYPDDGALGDRLRDPRCKGEDVQGDLAVLKGWMNMWTVVPALLVAMPMGLVAERFSPQTVLMMIWVGDALYMASQAIVGYYPDTFDIRLVYPCTLFMAVGGGSIVHGAMTYMYASGISSEENRSTIFLYVLAMQYLDSFITGPVSYFAMNIGPVFTMGVCLACFAVVFFLTPLLPKLPHLQAKHSSSDSSSEGAEQDDDGGDGRSKKAWYAKIADNATDMVAAFAAIFQNSFYAGLLLFGLVFSTLGASEQELRVQYVTKKFHWTWAQAGLLDTVRSAVSLPMVTVVLPSIAYTLQHRFQMPAVKKDLVIARTSVVILVTGSILQGLAPTAVLFVASVGFYELSRGYTAALLSLIAALVTTTTSTAEAGGGRGDGKKGHEGMVYVCVSMMQAAGALLAGPVLGQVFALGFRWGEAWYGLPFLVCAGLQFVCLVFAFVVKMDRT